MTVTTLSAVIVYTTDVARSAEFYEKQLGLARAYGDEHVISLRTPNGVEVLLHSSDRVTPARSSVGMTLRVDDVDATVEALRAAGYEVVREPADQDYGLRDAGVLDPDGHELWLAKPIS